MSHDTHAAASSGETCTVSDDDATAGNDDGSTMVVIVEIPRGPATSTRWTTTPARSGSTGTSSPRRSTRPTTASSPTPSPRTVTRWTCSCSSTSPRSPAATSGSGPSACSGWRDEAGPDAKVLCVPAGDPRFEHIGDLDDVPSHFRDEITHFFEVYKALEPNKRTELGRWDGREAARNAVVDARHRYSELHADAGRAWMMQGHHAAVVSSGCTRAQGGTMRRIAAALALCASAAVLAGVPAGAAARAQPPRRRRPGSRSPRPPRRWPIPAWSPSSTPVTASRCSRPTSTRPATPPSSHGPRPRPGRCSAWRRTRSSSPRGCGWRR